MAKNIIICCDGTGNEVDGDLSNVLKLYRIAGKTDEQRVFYDPGIGTLGTSSAWSRLRRKARLVFGLATGQGLDENVLDAYRFLCETYEQDDRIYLFGFSRGAYTVRVLAALIHMIGLLSDDQRNLADYALAAYKRASEKNDFHIAWDFGRMVSARRPTIHFMGLWDTVSSVLVPRSSFPYLPKQLTLPYTRENRSVRAVRHAVAIDERRRMFRSNEWVLQQPFVADRFAHPPVEVAQDTKVMWFAGVHADIGGGYPESESGLSKFPLAWVIDEAIANDLIIDQRMYEHLVLGEPDPRGRHTYVPPSASAKLHQSLSGFWWVLEYLPKKTKWREWPGAEFLHRYLPQGEPRALPRDADVHPSVAERKAACPNYRPINLP